MVSQINSDRRSFFCFKGIVLLFCIIWIAANLSCTSSTGSSSGSNSGTGVGWTVTVSAFPTSASASNGAASSIVVQVKDRSGNPAVKGTNVCVTAQRGTFVRAGSTPDNPLLDTTHCEPTTNDIGQVQVTYVPLALVQINIGTTDTPVYKVVVVAIATGPDIISASAMGVIGYTTIQVID